MTNREPPRRQRGRPKKTGEIQIRRFTALRELLNDHEDWLPVLEKSQLGEFGEAADIERQIDELFVRMMTGVSDLGAGPPDVTLRDEVKHNPEAQLLQALNTARWLRAMESEFERLRSRLGQLQDALFEAEKDARLWILVE